MTFLIDTSVSGWLLTITHIVAAVLGYLMCHWLTMHAGEALVPDESEQPVEFRYSEASKPPSPYIILLLVAALVLIGIGVQSFLSQRASNTHDECISDWGDELVQVVSRRGVALSNLEEAQTNRDDSLDSLLVASIGIRHLPDKKKDRALADLITGYVESVDRLRKVQKKVSNTRERNPFPPLRC